MLVLTRSNHNRVVIGHSAEVVIHILSIQGNYVRLGFEAPKTIPIYREEIYLKNQQEQIALQLPKQVVSHSCFVSAAPNAAQAVDACNNKNKN